MAIGGPGDEPRAAAPPQKAPAPAKAGLDREAGSNAPTTPAGDADKRPSKQVRAPPALKENGHGATTGASPATNHPPQRRFAHDASAETPEAGASPSEREQSPADTNGHSIPHRGSSQPPHATQPNMMGLTAAFDGLNVGGQPQLVHPHHPMGVPPHLAHRPHPGHLGQPPHGGHPHMHPAQVGGRPAHMMAQAGQPTTLQMWVPQDRVGAVIGSQGAVIKALQDRSRATIQVHNDTVQGDRKLFTIVGGPNECNVARQLVAEIIERPRSAHAAAHAPPASPGQASPHGTRGDRGSYAPYQQAAGDRPGELSKTVYVPTSCVGLVIGRRGETIRHLQGKSGASIFVTRDRDASQGAAERSVLISGTEQAINVAHQLVAQIVREAYARKHAGAGMPPGGGAPAATMMETLTVPDDKVGLIIGKGGAAIRELQSVSGAKIQVAKEDEGSSNSNTRPVAITGNRHCIEMAKQLIAEKVNMHLPPSSGMQTFSPQQGPPYAPPGQMYFPVYEQGFAPHMQGYPPHAPPQTPFDPNDPQAQMRAAMAYYQYYGHNAAAAYHHQQMQFQSEHARQHMGVGPPQAQGAAEGQENGAEAGSTAPAGEEQGPSQGATAGSPVAGDASAGQSPDAAASAVAGSTIATGSPPTSGQKSPYGLQDHRMNPARAMPIAQPHSGRRMHAQQLHPQQMAHQARVVAHMQAQAALHAQAQHAQAHAHARHMQAQAAQAAQETSPREGGETTAGGKEALTQGESATLQN